jgi:hypothetical protein
MMRMLPRVEATGCMRRLFSFAPEKNINRLQKLDFISTSLLKATDSFPAIIVLVGFDVKVSLQCNCS